MAYEAPLHHFLSRILSDIYVQIQCRNFNKFWD